MLLRLQHIMQLKRFQVGKEIESMSKDLGRWMGAIQDVKDGHKKEKGRSFGSVEEEALNLLLLLKHNRWKMIYVTL